MTILSSPVVEPSPPSADVSEIRAQTNSAHRELNTIDLIKTLAVMTMIIDHLGYYVFDEQLWLRLIGRTSAPIWFFLIGFAKSRHAPPHWIAWGLFVSIWEKIWIPGDETYLNILVSFALIRVCLPPLEEWWSRRPVLFWGAVMVLVLVGAITNKFLEYGSVGMLLALIGSRVRQHTESPQTVSRWTLLLLIFIAMVFYSYEQIVEFEFIAIQIAFFSLLCTTVAVLFYTFRFRTISWRVPHILTTLFRFCGRHSLAIYVIHLSLFNLAAGIEAKLE
jgi:uncharacterized membrane protein